MSRYRKIDVSMWGDAKFRSLSKPQPNARDCWQHLLSNRDTTSIPGVFRSYAESLARDLEWPVGDYLRVFQECIDKGMAVKADWEAGLVFMANATRRNPPANPNVVKSWVKVFDELPECELKTEIYQHIKRLLEPLGERFVKPFERAFANKPKTVPEIKNRIKNKIQEQDPDRSQGGNRGGSADRLSGHTSPPPLSNSQYPDRSDPGGCGSPPATPGHPVGNPNRPAGDPGGSSSPGHSPGAPAGDKQIHVIDLTPNPPRTDPGGRRPPPAASGVRGGDPTPLGACIPVQIADKRPIGDEHAFVQELQAFHAKRWGSDQPTGLPSGDNLQRVLQALRSPRFGFDQCKAAIAGHHHLASREGSQLGRSFRHVFPEARIGNNRHSCKLDADRFEEFVGAGRGRTGPSEETKRNLEQADKQRREVEEREAKALAERAGVQPTDSLKEKNRKIMAQVKKESKK